MTPRPAVFVLVVTLLIASPALAQTSRARASTAPPPPNQSWELFFGAALTNYQDDVDLDDEFGFVARFGYLFTPHHEIEFGGNFVWTNDSFFPGIDVYTNNLQTDYVYNFNTSGVVPYVMAGLGLFTTDDSSLGTETDLILGAGAGLKFFLGRATHVRFEYRYNRFEGDGEVYVNGLEVSVSELTFGVGWRFPLR